VGNPRRKGLIKTLEALRNRTINNSSSSWSGRNPKKNKPKSQIGR